VSADKILLCAAGAGVHWHTTQSGHTSPLLSSPVSRFHSSLKPRSHFYLATEKALHRAFSQPIAESSTPSFFLCLSIPPQHLHPLSELPPAFPWQLPAPNPSRVRRRLQRRDGLAELVAGCLQRLDPCLEAFYPARPGAMLGAGRGPEAGQVAVGGFHSGFGWVGGARRRRL
jgi:hypothetical protein